MSSGVHKIACACECDGDPGAHYRRRGGIEPIAFIASNHLDFLEGNVVKYVARWRHKNGIEDLRKAAWYIDRLIKQAEVEEVAEVAGHVG